MIIITMMAYFRLSGEELGVIGDKDSEIERSLGSGRGFAETLVYSVCIKLAI